MNGPHTGMVIRVTQEDIDRGDPCTAVGCPIALAAQRTLGTYATVGTSAIYVVDGYNDRGFVNYQVYHLPDSAKLFIENLDLNDERGDDDWPIDQEIVKPFSFEIGELV